METKTKDNVFLEKLLKERKDLVFNKIDLIKGELRKIEEKGIKEGFDLEKFNEIKTIEGLLPELNLFIDSEVEKRDKDYYNSISAISNLYILLKYFDFDFESIVRDKSFIYNIRVLNDYYNSFLK
jgi:hypothetical protein